MHASYADDFTAFEGFHQVASGDVVTVGLACKRLLDRDEGAAVLIFNDRIGEQTDFDLRGSESEVRERLKELVRGAGPRVSEEPSAEPGPRGPGRPRLGVVAREVTLLPRHWDWLSTQPGGASVALRKLVDQARRASETTDRVRHSREAVYRVLAALGGNLAGFEEASRALFAGDRARFEQELREWPADVRAYLARLAGAAFAPLARPASAPESA